VFNAESAPLLIGALKKLIKAQGTVALRVEGRIRWAKAEYPAVSSRSAR